MFLDKSDFFLSDVTVFQDLSYLLGEYNVIKVQQDLQHFPNALAQVLQHFQFARARKSQTTTLHWAHQA